jgi:demethylmenaquinone methyltransferase/2-methoxy-6-polyprenyl-1,4-benzoquinol methylase
MKILETVSTRYDSGIRLITSGRILEVYDRLTGHIRNGQKVLDIGCGTGALAIRAAGKGAIVTGIDVNPNMLAVARKKAEEYGVGGKMELIEMGVAELAHMDSEHFDAVISGLCFSELSQGELSYALKEIIRVLRPNGYLLVADEVRPDSFFWMILHRLMRFPLVIATYLITQKTTRSLRQLPEQLQKAGFSIESLSLTRMRNFIELKAKKIGNESA